MLVGLITRRSQVQMQSPILVSAQIAQLVEQRTENPRVGSSILPLGIMRDIICMMSLFYFQY